MKYKFFAATVIISFCIFSCNSSNDKKVKEEKKGSAIDGTWELVSSERNSKFSHPMRSPSQLKMFNDGWFSFMMYNDSGNFYYAGAGPFELKDNMYKETFRYSSDTTYINWKDWQKWEMKGDTLIFYGFEKVENPNGKEVTADWNRKGTFIEKRVRVKNIIF